MRKQRTRTRISIQAVRRQLLDLDTGRHAPLLEDDVIVWHLRRVGYDVIGAVDALRAIIAAETPRLAARRYNGLTPWARAQRGGAALILDEATSGRES
ncbi:MAG: hypothetical protein Q8S13_03765 [Dehalococcoidia bacterium]|nr:hypothetical protein [Dehalococcoidia bacterium]